MTFVGLRSKVRAFAAVLLLAALAACGSGGDLGTDPSAPPAITTQPASESANDQGTATFSVTAAGEGLSYQWQRNGINIVDATLAVYTTPALSLSDSGAVYTVIVSNGGGSVTSSPATLTVVPAPPTISAQPADATVVDDDTATFSVTARGTAPLSYQWYRNGAAIAGATAVTYTTAATDVQDSGATYRVVVTGSVGSAQSRDARLTVAPRPPTITTQPANASVALGAGASFTAQASGTGPFTWQWYRNGTVISGATSSTYALSASTYGDDGSLFTATATNGGGTGLSQAATLTVNASAPTTISACQDITVAGAYRLGADLSESTVSATCITVTASNVQLDCANHLISATATNASAVDVVGASEVSVKNCRLQAERMTLTNATRVTVSANTFSVPPGGAESTVFASHGNRLAINGNTIETGAINSSYGISVGIANNTISARAGTSGPDGAVKVAWGSGTWVFGNTLDGRWNSDRGAAIRNGAQAAVAVVDERDIVIDGNTMRNLFTCGVELTGNVSRLLVRSNRVENAGQCGFGGNQWLSISESRFVANTVDRSGGIFHLYRTLGLRPAGTVDPEGALGADTAVVFRDIVVDGNVLTTPLPPDGVATVYPASIIPVSDLMDYPLSGPGSVSSIPGERAAVAGDFQISGLRFVNNNFGRTASGPVSFGNGPFTAGVVIDGGRNVCPVAGLTGYPLACN